MFALFAIFSEPPDGGAPFPEHLDEFVDADGFREIIVHPFGETFFAVLSGGIGGHGDDDGPVAVAFSADDPGGFEAVHFGHLDVHEDEVVWGFVEFFEGLDAVLGDVGFIAHLA